MIILRNRTQIATFVSIILLLYSPSALSQTGSVDEYIKAQMKKRNIPGLALAVIEAGEIVKVKGYGFSDIEHNVPVRANTIFQSGSVGKQITSFAIMMLVEEGKIDLDDPINKYLDGSPGIWKDITVRHLLTHTSGIRDYEKKIDYRGDYTEEDFFKMASGQPLDFSPGEHWSYSNTGYVLLGILIKKVSGQYWGDFVHDRIFTPLKMETARVISEDDIILNRASGYRLVEGEIKNQEWVSPSLNTTADGALYVSVLDMAKWDAGFYTPELLSKTSLEEMWAPVKLNNGKVINYGFGWWFKDIRGHRVTAHSGGWQGFSAYIARYIDDSLTVVVLANQGDVKLALIAHNVASFFNPELRPDDRKVITLAQETLDSYVGRYELSSRLIVNVSRKDDKLLVSYGDNPKEEFFAESTTMFFAKDEDMEIEFITNEEGEATHLLFDWGVVEEAKRIE